MNRKIIGMILFSLFVFSMGVSASERPIINYRLNETVIQQFKKTTPNLREVYGEITIITARSLNLHTATGDFKFEIAPFTKVYRNGFPALWNTLHPITTTSFYEAQIFLNSSNKIQLVNGFYFGEEMIIQDWRHEGNNLCLNLVSPYSKESYWWRLSQTARTPKGLAWLQKDQEIFALYGFLNEIRAVYLPE